jgi:Initiator Replication protein
LHFYFILSNFVLFLRFTTLFWLPFKNILKTMPTIQRKSVSIIKKSNELIEARYKFDIWETRVFLSVLAQIQRTDEDFQEYKIIYKSIIRHFPRLS